MIAADHDPLSTEPLTRDEKLRLVQALDDAEHLRLMYRSAFDALIAANERIKKQQECIAELRETIRAMACAAIPAEERE